MPGDNIHQAVDQGIRLYDKILLCASVNSLNDPWVESEIEAAVEKERRLMKVNGQKTLALIPLNLDGYMFDDSGWESGFSHLIRGRTAADFSGWKSDEKKFSSQLGKLVRALRADEGRKAPPPAPKL